MSAIASFSKFNIMQEKAFRPILSVWVLLCAIDAMLYFDGNIDGDANADVKCEQSIIQTWQMALTRNSIKSYSQQFHDLHHSTVYLILTNIFANIPKLLQILNPHIF